jgi:sugar O-acyltransferase (sialic acid O-acetyltransferase NeuD family)
MANQKVVIIGAGGFGREVLDVFEAVNQAKPTYEILGFIVEPGYQNPGTILNDIPILGYYDWLEENKADVQAICGVGAPEQRRRLIHKAEKIGVQFCTVIHPNAIYTRWMEVGTGSIITAGCILTNNIYIGNHVHLNLDCTVGHDVIIEDFVTVSPGVHISGNVKLREGSFIGTGANLIEGKEIGAWSVVGAGCAVIKDVEPNTLVVGVPGKVAKTMPEGWHRLTE